MNLKIVFFTFVIFACVTMATAQRQPDVVVPFHVKTGAIEKAQKVLDALSSGSNLAASMQPSDVIEIVPESPYIRASIKIIPKVM